MKALNTLRHLAILFAFVLAAATASASDGAKRSHKAANRPAVECAAGSQRKAVAPFVDPTLPLTELVERVRAERSH